MTLLRVDVERALDDLISNEEGMRFQGLALLLAKEKWPALVASERKKDLGSDGQIPTFLAADGYATAFASSLTATLAKVKSDLLRIRQTSHDVRRLVFMTPARVTNETIEKWRQDISALDVDLIVISREDVTLELLRPHNRELCRSHLNLGGAAETSETLPLPLSSSTTDPREVAEAIERLGETCEVALLVDSRAVVWIRVGVLSRQALMTRLARISTLLCRLKQVSVLELGLCDTGNLRRTYEIKQVAFCRFRIPASEAVSAAAAGRHTRAFWEKVGVELPADENSQWQSWKSLTFFEFSRRLP